jgi:hypothetical protein
LEEERWPQEVTEEGEKISEGSMVIFTKDRQGAITSTDEVRLTSFLDDTSISASMFTSDQLAAISLPTNKSNQYVYKITVEYVNATKNTSNDQATIAVDLSPGPSTSPVNLLLHQSLQIVANQPLLNLLQIWVIVPTSSLRKMVLYICFIMNGQMIDHFTYSYS